MPCQDITESIFLHLDPDGRVVSYRLHKRTCGAAIGDASVLLPLVHQVPLDALPGILAPLSADEVPRRLGLPAASQRDFLFHKHLVALQAAAQVLLGEAAADPDALCTAASIGVADDGLHFEGSIAGAAVTTAIRACGNCRHCGRYDAQKGRANGALGG